MIPDGFNQTHDADGAHLAPERLYDASPSAYVNLSFEVPTKSFVLRVDNAVISPSGFVRDRQGGAYHLDKSYWMEEERRTARTYSVKKAGRGLYLSLIVRYEKVFQASSSLAHWLMPCP